jgi:hypothetical protein
VMELMVVLVGAKRRKSERMHEIGREGPSLGEPGGNDTSTYRSAPTV